MSDLNLNNSLKYENVNLHEDLMFFKSQNIFFRSRILDLEDEMRVLKEKLRKSTDLGEKEVENNQLGPHFPEKLLETN